MLMHNLYSVSSSSVPSAATKASSSALLPASSFLPSLLQKSLGISLNSSPMTGKLAGSHPTPKDTKGSDKEKMGLCWRTLVVQYEVKLQNGLECGGAYLKLLRDNKALHQEEFSNASPYVHLIINHKNPKTGEYEEKHMTPAPAARILKTTELYTLIIHPNNTAIIKLDGEQVKEVNLLSDDFVPAFNPPKEIDDAKDTKPDTWVDEARIADQKLKKPEDWDEDAPFEIVDEEATKPEDWLEDEPLVIPDPEAQKPEDWDDEEDGDWIAPTVQIPSVMTSQAVGVWAPRKIKNPDYYEDKTPSNLEPMGAIGFEIWTMQSDILFDNIYIGHSVEDAAKFADETFHEKHPIEQLIEIESVPKPEDKPKSPSDLVFTDDPVLYVKEKLDLFFTIAQNDPIQAINMGGSTPPPQVKKAAAKAKDTAADAKDKVAEAVTSGTDAAKAEVNKRSTRSSS
ncbi:hypothetical protein DID88_004241 [Monilinia fructigena]|uniref:Calreticulin n=1 Tax=Monilinia fructigena TaxID=38457 RepID=A0A395ISM7_9HELO|nr:hypothetical protein DID88_004241 [Monilinia fructigena]